MDRREVIRLLQEMNAQQEKTDRLGYREVAWYYWRDEVEVALGCEPGTIAQFGAEEDSDG